MIKIVLGFDFEFVRSIANLSNKMYFEPVYEAWAVMYRAAMKLRFSVFSRGGGDWAPLAESTIKRRRKGKGKSKGKQRASILIDSGTLWNTLQPHFGDAPGQIQELITNGIRVGIGGGDIHSENLTIAKLAYIHHFGSTDGRIPARPILVEPEEKTKILMANAFIKAFKGAIIKK